MTKFEKILLNENISFIFSIFGNKNIWLVGGALRDFFLQKKLKDFDFTTIYTPNELIEICKKNKINFHKKGFKYGTITLIIKQKQYEITTLRTEKYKNSRFPEVNYFNKDNFDVSLLEKDAKRRDFTINALYLSYNGKLIDPLKNFTDLENAKLSFIGDIKERIQYDPLRILRYLRFLATYDLSINENELSICNKNAYLLGSISKERKRAEFEKILDGKNKKLVFNLLAENKNIWNELFDAPYNAKNVNIDYNSKDFIFFNLYLHDEPSKKFTYTRQEKKILEIYNNIKNINENDSEKIIKYIFLWLKFPKYQDIDYQKIINLYLVKHDEKHISELYAKVINNISLFPLDIKKIISNPDLYKGENKKMILANEFVKWLKKVNY